MTVHKLKESISVGQAGRQGRRGGCGLVGVVHHYHGRQFCAQPNKIRNVIIIFTPWHEMGGGGMSSFGKAFFLKVRKDSGGRKAADGQSHQSHSCVGRASMCASMCAFRICSSSLSWVCFFWGGVSTLPAVIISLVGDDSLLDPLLLSGRVQSAGMRRDPKPDEEPF